MIKTSKIKLQVVGDEQERNRVYQYIRDMQYLQYTILNRQMGALCSEFYRNGRDLKNEEFIKARKEIFRYKDNNLYDDLKKLPSMSYIFMTSYQRIQKDFSSAIKNGLAKGERSITNYKRTFPLLVPGSCLKFYHDYPNEDILHDLKEDGNLEVYLKWINKCHFRLIFGNPHRSGDLRATMMKVLDGDYKPLGSSIAIQDKSIYLFLSTEHAEKKVELDPERTIGIALGYDTPIVCAMNQPDEVYRISGTRDFVRQRTAIQERYRMTQAASINSRGGHGRKRKLKALCRFRDYERNFAGTYNHVISRDIVSWAVENHVGTICMEDMTRFSQLYKGSVFLRNWSYFDLQNKITYKAKEYGINVIGKKLDSEEMPCPSCRTPFRFTDKGTDTDNMKQYYEAICAGSDTVCCTKCGKEFSFSVYRAKVLSNL